MSVSSVLFSGEYCVHIAAIRNDVAILRQLVNSGADINVRVRFFCHASAKCALFFNNFSSKFKLLGRTLRIHAAALCLRKRQRIAGPIHSRRVRTARRRNTFVPYADRLPNGGRAAKSGADDRPAATRRRDAFAARKRRRQLLRGRRRRTLFRGRRRRCVVGYQQYGATCNQRKSNVVVQPTTTHQHLDCDCAVLCVCACLYILHNVNRNEL